MEKAAVDAEGLLIPLIDFSKFLNGTPTQRRDTAAAMVHGFQTAGFVYLCNLPITRATRERIFALSADFFAQPEAAKLRVSWTTPEANRGYSAPGREKGTQETDAAAVSALRRAAPDLKESIEMGREDDPAHPNRWPDLPGFRAAMLDFHDQCNALHVGVMRAVAVGMGLDETFFDAFIDVCDNVLRLLHYPAVDKRAFQTPGTVRAGEHSDYGTITLLFQDGRGGLQVRGPSGCFVDAKPIEDTCIVNAGDLLARWSNDTIKSTVHRVVEPPVCEGDVHPPRYSVAYFCNTNPDSNIDAIPGTYATESDKKYEAINSGQYLVQRLAATYKVY